MANDGQIVFEVTADGKHAIADIKAITAAIQKETKKWDDSAKKSADSIMDSFSGMLKKLVAGFSAVKIGKMLLDIGKDALQAASDLQEVQNVVDVTFGDNASKIEKWAKSAADQFGLTETQAKRFTSTMGAMLKSSGLAGDEIVNMSTDLAGLAADMASFYNLDFDTAFQKIRSGISGETEPLKQLGINMSVANLNAFALQQGLEKTFEQMDQGEQTMLRYQYMMSVTSDAQGDFARTSDGYANSLRRAESAVEGIKAKLGEFLIGPAANALNWVNEFLGSLTAEPERTVLDDFKEIEVDTAGKLAELQKTYDTAKSIIEIIDEIEQQTVTLTDGSTVSFAELFKDIGNVEASGGDVREYLESLGVDVDNVLYEYNKWKEATRQLTNTVPALTSVIDSETGAIDGGTEALKKNLDEWKSTEEKKLLWTAYYAKARALEEKKAEMHLYELEAMGAEKAIQRAKEAYDKAYKDAGGAQFYIEYVDKAGKYALTKEDVEKYNQLAQLQRDIEDATERSAKAQEEFNRQTNDFVDAEQELADEYDALIELTGEEEKALKEAGKAAGDFAGKTEDAWKKSTNGAAEALKALADYVQGVRDSTEQAVNSVVKGFEQIKRPTQELTEQRSKLIEEQNALDKSAKDYQQKWDAIQEKIDDVNEKIEKFEPKGMKDALTSQLAFMQEYMVNLEKARQMGLSNELLASLSDGTPESAEYLMQLVADPTAAKEIDALYKQVQERKKEFTDELTQQQLTADQVYQNMAEEAKKAVAELDLGEQAKEYAGKTIAEMAQGITDNVDGVKTAVDSVVEQLNRLADWNISIDFGSFGEISFGVSAEQIHSHETGLDRVPFDGYLASLHEGESVLTAEEARVWNRFKNGSGTIDYDTMGGVLRDNVKPGGNVYLDGRVVGSVISDQQGKSYRQLQRSGWQG